MHLKNRPAVLEDFNGYFAAQFFPYRDAPTFRAILEAEWHIFAAHAPDLTMLVEDMEREPGDRVVGFAQSVFVTDACVSHLMTVGQPYVNAHISRALPDGGWPLLDRKQICDANSGDGLNMLVTHWVWREAGLTPEEQRAVRDFLFDRYRLFYRGYNFKRILIETHGEWAFEALRYAGFQAVNAYPDSAEPLSIYLMSISREEAERSEGTLISREFVYAPPRFYFKPHEQELLRLALHYASDAEAQAQLCVTDNTIRKRWQAIYERVSTRCQKENWESPLPASAEGKRGSEKRRLLLQYLREHLEELRPTRRPPP